jgi:hypothetical protein
MRDAVKAIKAKNPNIVIVDYVIQETIHNTYPGLKPFRDKLDAEHWWLYRNGGGGTKVGPDAAVSTTNFTNSAPQDANGDRWNTWFAKYVHKQMWSQIPELDGTFTDNVFWKPRVSGDWNRDGSTDSQQNTGIYPAFRTGMMEHLNQIRALMPGKLVTGNIGDWGRPEATVPEFKGQLDGGLLEHYIGQTWSNEGVDLNGNFNGWGSWSRMMDAYRKVMGLVKAPKLVIFNMKGKPTDYKTFRYGFASTLMDDGYFDFSDGTSGSIRDRGDLVRRIRRRRHQKHQLVGKRYRSPAGHALAERCVSPALPERHGARQPARQRQSHGDDRIRVQAFQGQAGPCA